MSNVTGYEEKYEIVEDMAIDCLQTVQVYVPPMYQRKIDRHQDSIVEITVFNRASFLSSIMDEWSMAKSSDHLRLLVATVAADVGKFAVSRYIMKAFKITDTPRALFRKDFPLPNKEGYWGDVYDFVHKAWAPDYANGLVSFAAADQQKQATEQMT